ncbi:MAG: hypothetical protein JWL77_91 [Chthonomonadaceae bacterium]|nr:hypothetical protein [Chthonomonadaceae bacterium]
MRRGMELFVGMAAACGLLMLTPQPSRAAGVEKSLLGVRILQTYREVLKLYGAPTRVYRITEKVPVVESTNADGDLTGGIRSLGDSAGGGMPGGGGPPGSGGMPGSGGGARAGSSMQVPGEGGKGGGMPGSGGMPGGGIGGAGGSESNTTFGQAGGYIWAYYYPLTEKLYLFLFNAQGRLLVTFERGRYGGGGTSNGLNLGSSLASVYSLYGWPDNVEEQGPGIVLNYSQKHHLLVAVLKGKVVGLAVSLFELPKLRMLAINEEGSGGGGGPTGSGGGGRGAGKGGGGGGAASGGSSD